MIGISWNLSEGSDEVPENIHELIRGDIQHDIYVIAAQNGSSTSKLEKNVISIIGSNYVTIAQETYRLLTLLFIGRKRIKDVLNIKDIQIDHYRDINKTTKAVAIGLRMADKNYAFINGYVNPKTNSKSVDQSEGDKDCAFLPKVIEIDQTLLLRPSNYEEQKLLADPSQSDKRISEIYDACIFMGGFNTPIIGSAQVVNSLMSANLYESLKKNDKMYLEFRNYAKKKADELSPTVMKKISYDYCQDYEEHGLMSQYHEGEIMFAPTYKVIPFTDSYDTSIITLSDVSYSGWTDRILWTISEGDEFRKKQEFLKQISYDSNNLIKSSQHRPVFSQFLIYI